MHIWACACVRVCMCACVHICSLECVRVFVCECDRAYARSCVHARACSFARTHSCRLPTAYRISSRVTLSIALEMRFLSVSPTPIGLTPGRLSRAMRRHAVREDIPCGST